MVSSRVTVEKYEDDNQLMNKSVNGYGHPIIWFDTDVL